MVDEKLVLFLCERKDYKSSIAFKKMKCYFYNTVV